jgi:hypothetical protein
MTWGNGHEFDPCPVRIRHKENTLGLRVGSVVPSFLKNHTANRLQFQGSGFNIVDDEGKMGEPQVIPPVDWRAEDSWGCVMEQFDFQGTESNELGRDVYRWVHFGDLTSQVITIFLYEAETLAVKPKRTIEVGDAQPEM